MSNLKIQNIWNSLKSMLTAQITPSGNLSYVLNLYEGYREDVPQNAFPCIMLDPVDESEKVIKLPYHVRMVLSVDIYCVTGYVVYDTQIAGDVSKNVKGIFDFCADVKNTLWADPSLQGSALFFEFGKPINYKFWNVNNYYYRAGVIQINVTQEATKVGR